MLGLAADRDGACVVGVRDRGGTVDIANDAACASCDAAGAEVKDLTDVVNVLDNNIVFVSGSTKDAGHALLTAVRVLCGDVACVVAALNGQTVVSFANDAANFVRTDGVRVVEAADDGAVLGAHSADDAADVIRAAADGRHDELAVVCAAFDPALSAAQFAGDAAVVAAGPFIVAERAVVDAAQDSDLAVRSADDAAERAFAADERGFVGAVLDLGFRAAGDNAADETDAVVGVDITLEGDVMDVCAAGHKCEQAGAVVGAPGAVLDVDVDSDRMVIADKFARVGVVGGADADEVGDPGHVDVGHEDTLEGGLACLDLIGEGHEVGCGVDLHLGFRSVDRDGLRGGEGLAVDGVLDGDGLGIDGQVLAAFDGVVGDLNFIAVIIDCDNSHAGRVEVFASFIHGLRGRVGDLDAGDDGIGGFGDLPLKDGVALIDVTGVLLEAVAEIGVEGFQCVGGGSGGVNAGDRDVFAAEHGSVGAFQPVAVAECEAVLVSIAQNAAVRGSAGNGDLACVIGVRKAAVTVEVADHAADAGSGLRAEGSDLAGVVNVLDSDIGATIGSAENTADAALAAGDLSGVDCAGVIAAFDGHARACSADDAADRSVGRDRSIVPALLDEAVAAGGFADDAADSDGTVDSGAVDQIAVVLAVHDHAVSCACLADDTGLLVADIRAARVIAADRAVVRAAENRDGAPGFANDAASGAVGVDGCTVDAVFDLGLAGDGTGNQTYVVVRIDGAVHCDVMNVCAGCEGNDARAVVGARIAFNVHADGDGVIAAVELTGVGVLSGADADEVGDFGHVDVSLEDALEGGITGADLGCEGGEVFRSADLHLGLNDCFFDRDLAGRGGAAAGGSDDGRTGFDGSDGAIVNSDCVAVDGPGDGLIGRVFGADGRGQGGSLADGEGQLVLAELQRVDGDNSRSLDGDEVEDGLCNDSILTVLHIDGNHGSILGVFHFNVAGKRRELIGVHLVLLDHVGGQRGRIKLHHGVTGAVVDGNATQAHQRYVVVFVSRCDRDVLFRVEHDTIDQIAFVFNLFQRAGLPTGCYSDGGSRSLCCVCRQSAHGQKPQHHDDGQKQRQKFFCFPIVHVFISCFFLISNRACGKKGLNSQPDVGFSVSPDA